MTPYPAYKDSGIEWLGEVPEHWEVKKLKYCFDFDTGFTPSTGRQDYYLNGEHIWITIGDMNKKVVSDSEQKITDLAIKDNQQKSIKKGSLLYSFKLSVGKVAFAGKDCYSNEAIMSLPPSDDVNLAYYYYALPEQVIKNAQENIYGAKLLNQDLIKNAFLIFPPPAEQTAIAAYLDRKTAQIDSLIEQKRRLIALLQEERTALISQAVTKGLNPAVPMQDSGIEWIGAVPVGWMTLPIKRIVETPVTDGPHETPELFDDGIPFISAEAVKNNKLDFSKKRGYISVEAHQKYSRKYKPQKGDIYMVKSGATTGNVAIVETDEEFNIWSPLAAIRPNSDIAQTGFVFYFMQSINFFQAIESGWSFGTQQNIGMGVIENIALTVPPLAEQTAITAYLDKKTAQIDQTIARTERQIELLQEYRTALISAVVTGKVDVREEVVELQS